MNSAGDTVQPIKFVIKLGNTYNALSAHCADSRCSIVAFPISVSVIKFFLSRTIMEGKEIKISAALKPVRSINFQKTRKTRHASG